MTDEQETEWKQLHEKFLRLLRELEELKSLVRATEDPNTHFHPAPPTRQ